MKIIRFIVFLLSFVQVSWLRACACVCVSLFLLLVFLLLYTVHCYIHSFWFRKAIHIIVFSHLFVGVFLSYSLFCLCLVGLRFILPVAPFAVPPLFLPVSLLHKFKMLATISGCFIALSFYSFLIRWNNARLPIINVFSTEMDGINIQRIHI